MSVFVCAAMQSVELFNRPVVCCVHHTHPPSMVCVFVCLYMCHFLSVLMYICMEVFIYVYECCCCALISVGVAMLLYALNVQCFTVVEDIPSADKISK